MIDESITHIMKENILIFFEILDSPTVETKTFFSKYSKATEEWHFVCWGFLKPGDAMNSYNIDRRSCLQLFHYQRRHFLQKYSLNVYDQFRLKRIKYPATLTVTVKGIAPLKSPFNFPEEKEQTKLKWEENLTQSHFLKFTDMQNTSTVQSNLLQRLPGQICKHPNIMYKAHLEPSSKGCLISKFSPNGQFLAYSFNSDYNIQIATVPDLKVINTLRGHTNFVYDLDWLADKRKNSFPLHLVSASSDRTAILWTIEKDRISLTILPHPSFLYAAKFLVNLPGDERCLLAVTGGRDSTIRVWKVVQNNFDLLQESVEHHNYITSIVCAMKTKNFYSSDWNGWIFEWSNVTNSNNFQVMRKFPKLTDSILSLQLHPKNEQRLYAQLKNHQINYIDTANEIVLNTLGSTDDDQNCNKKFTISPCSSTIYTVLWDTICMYDVLTGTLQSSLKVPHVKHHKFSYVSHLDYHPKLFLLSAAVYDLNGGILLFSHKSEGNLMDKEVIHQDSFDDRWKLLKGQVSSNSSELLGNIIQRIDDILHQPLRHKNETDDFKNENLSHLNRSDASDGNEDVGQAEVELFDIVSESDSDSTAGSGGTFTIRKQSISDEISNKTFTLDKNGVSQNRVQRLNDGTYSIDANDNSDDTTVSESM
ncbi:Jouberin [Pseudolycoriella hygida]|uniref:Jouberin n=1 Tax=Pseudolycoriella hygida TaxID=35572 RepID=A0A9Q0N8W6_9DIPT|nr:Jouberin [Pseudolycoriella hygida]